MRIEEEGAGKGSAAEHHAGHNGAVNGAQMAAKPQARAGLMEGKRALVAGVANDRSIAWAIAQAFRAQGAEVAFTYPGETMGRRVIPLVQPVAAAVIDCDVQRDTDLERAPRELARVWDRLDVLVHSIAFAPRDAMSGRFTEATTREAWRTALEVSAYSLVALARAFKPMMPPESSILTLSYYGAEKVVTRYNVMGIAKAALECSVRYLAQDLGQDGIRVNAVSAGPLRTLAAAGIRGMRGMLEENAERTPLRRNIEHADIGGAAVYLCSSLGRNVTGETLHVDAGQNIMGVVAM